jgi:DNA-binding GntR family transcriptional regulator
MTRQKTFFRMVRLAHPFSSSHWSSMPLPLASRLAVDIVALIAQQQMSEGTRLPERGLAEQLRVSRSPIRQALKELAGRGLIDQHPDGGFVVSAATLAAGPTEDAQPAEEATYLLIAGDRLDGVLPDRITENELMRRYGLTRGQLNAVLRRMAHEAWIERLPGHGWAFLPTLISADAYAQGYRFRLLMEPAGILESTFVLNRPALKRCETEQRLLSAGDVLTVSPAHIFDANTRLHETIAECSGNMFILDSLCRLNRLRRLMEYRKAVDRQQALRRCEEHLKLIELLQQDDREGAADFMRLHLRDAAREKTMAVAA